MTVRTLLTYPDQRLFKPATPVNVFDEGLHTLAQDMFDTMHAAAGVGITAPHIGVLKRVVVLALPQEMPDVYQVYINPEIVEASKETVQFDEGSISMPGVLDKIVRAERVTVHYVDVNGNRRVEEAEGFRAVCHQHEIDQLDGVFWTSKLSRLKRERIITRFGKLQRGK